MDFKQGFYDIQVAFAENKVKLDQSRFANRAVKLELGERLEGVVDNRGALHALSFPITKFKAPFEVITRIEVHAKNLYNSRTFLPRGGNWVDRLYRVELREDGVVLASSDESKNPARNKFDYNVIVPFVGFLADDAKLEVRLIIEQNTGIPEHLKKHAYPWIRDDRWAIVVHGGDIQVDKFSWVPKKG